MTPLVLLVTGCSQGGLGYDICEEFASRGCKVYAGVRKVSAAQGLEPLGVVVLEMDVTDQRSRENAVAAVLEAEGHVDILVNNAGITEPTGPMVELNLDDMRKTYETNFFAPVALTQLVVPHMAKQKKGMIINIASIAAYLPTPFMAVYGSSKAALTSMSNGLRSELKPLGIHVMHVALGSVVTNIHSKIQASLSQWPADSAFKLQQVATQNSTQAFSRMSSSSKDAARHLVSSALSRSPPRCLWTGTASWFARVMHLFPLWLQDLIVRVTKPKPKPSV